MQNEIKAILFDLGKVIFDVSFDRTFEFWAKASGKKTDDIKKNFRFDEVYEKFETTEISAAEFRARVLQRLGISLPDKVFDEGWCNLYLDVYPGTDRLLAELKQNYRVVALTNTNEIHATVWKIKYADTLRHFEKVFSSHEIKTRKPEEQAYKIVLNYLELEAAQTVFIDDNTDNINGADRLGINTILVSSHEQMTGDLKKILES